RVPSTRNDVAIAFPQNKAARGSGIPATPHGSPADITRTHLSHASKGASVSKWGAAFGMPFPPTPGETTMTSPKELEAKLWDALEDDRTVMLGLEGNDGGHIHPMTAMS